jgi:class 3 adenylate cyclase
VVSRIIHAPDSEVGLEAAERDVTVMFCDLVGFTAMVEHLTAGASRRRSSTAFSPA